MSSIFKKAFAAMLAILMLPLVSCSKSQSQPKESESATEQRLVIEDVFTPYTDQDKQRIASRLLGVFSATVKAMGGELTEEKTETVKARIEKNIIPLLELGGVSPEQVEKAIPEKISAGDIVDVYFSSVSLIGSEQAGRLLYEFSTVYLAAKAEKYDKLYSESADESDLESAKRYARQRWELENNLGEECFVAASNFLFSCVSSIKKADLGAGMGNLMQGDTAGAVLSVIRRQSSEAARLPLDSEQWGMAAEIVFEIIMFDIKPEGEMSETQLAYLENISHRSDVANMIGQSIPELLSLYAQVAHKMTNAEMSLVLSKIMPERIRGVCLALLRGEKKFISLAQKIEEIELDGEYGYAVIESAGLADEYEAYAAKRQNIGADEFSECIRKCADEEQKDKGTEIFGCIEDFLFGVAPYATFIFMNDF